MKQEQEANSIRKPGYKAPRLTIFGSIKDLTRQHAKTVTADKGGNNMAS